MTFREKSCPLFCRTLIKDNPSFDCLMAEFLSGSVGSTEGMDELCGDYF